MVEAATNAQIKEIFERNERTVRSDRRKKTVGKAELWVTELDALLERIRTAEAREARLSEALRKAGVSFETIRLTLIKNLEEPERSAFWEAVHARDATRAALSGSGSGGRECATEGCAHAATVRCARDGVESEYCHACYMRIWELPAAPQQGGE